MTDDLRRLLVVALSAMAAGVLLLVAGLLLGSPWVLALGACCFVVAAVTGARLAGRAQRDRDEHPDGPPAG